MCSHFGLEPGTGHEDAEAIIRCDDPQELTDEQLNLVLLYEAGLPPGYSLTDEQESTVAKALLQAPGGPSGVGVRGGSAPAPGGHPGSCP